MSKVANPHDKFFRASMSYLKVAQSFFAAHLPKSLSEHINLNTLRPCKNNFINAELKEQLSDILYQVDLIDKSGFIYLLVEHQSKPDRLMSFRIWRYILRIIECHQRRYKTPSLPIIYPLVFYHGKKRYPYTTNFFDLFAERKDLAKLVYLQSFQLIDVSTIPDSKIKQSSYSGIMELVLKKVYEQDLTPYICDIIELVKVLDQQGEFDYIEGIIFYITATSEVQDAAAFLKQLNRSLSPTVGEKIMTIADQLKAQGHDKGFSKGINQGIDEGIGLGEQRAKIAIAQQMLNEGMDTRLIERLTGIAEAELITEN